MWLEAELCVGIYYIVLCVARVGMRAYMMTDPLGRRRRGCVWNIFCIWSRLNGGGKKGAFSLPKTTFSSGGVLESTNQRARIIADISYLFLRPAIGAFYLAKCKDIPSNTSDYVRVYCIIHTCVTHISLCHSRYISSISYISALSMIIITFKRRHNVLFAPSFPFLYLTLF